MLTFNTEISFKALEPALIDEELIRKNLDEQGPKGEASRLQEQDGLKLEEVKTLRLEFLNVLAIDHLWMMTSLVELDLSNNIIEKIENLESLVNLKVLSLSFNFIEKIENLETLVNLEILTLFENDISKIENLDSLSKLMILSLGNNKISNWGDILYLRKFQSLQSLNMAGNPCCSENPNGDGERNKRNDRKLDEMTVRFGDGMNIDPKDRKNEFRIYTVAHLPKLRFFEYFLVNDEEREKGQKKYRHKLLLLEEEEEKERLAIQKMKEEIEFVSRGKAAWVDRLYGSVFIDEIFEADHFGKAMSSLDENMQEIYKEFCSQFVKVTSDLYDMALIRKVERDKEEEQFIKCLQLAKDKTGNERKIIMADFFLEKELNFKKLISLIGSLEDTKGIKQGVNVVDGSKHKPSGSLAEVEEGESEEYEVIGQIQNLNFDFSDLCQKTMETLMNMEMHLYEQIEETLANYERKITDLVNDFIERAQALFVSCRYLKTNFSEQLATIVPRFFNTIRARIAASKITKQEKGSLGLDKQESNCSVLPKILEECLESTEALQNAIASSHDIHVQMIDVREDTLINEARTWLKENLHTHSRSEIRGNRERLYEIITVINQAKEEFEDLQASLVTLPMLADMEINDV